MATFNVAKIRYYAQSLPPTRIFLALYSEIWSSRMTQKGSMDGKEEFVLVKKSDLERIVAILSRLESESD